MKRNLLAGAGALAALALLAGCGSDDANSTTAAQAKNYPAPTQVAAALNDGGVACSATAPDGSLQDCTFTGIASEPVTLEITVFDTDADLQNNRKIDEDMVRQGASAMAAATVYGTNWSVKCHTTAEADADKDLAACQKVQSILGGELVNKEGRPA